MGGLRALHERDVMKRQQELTRKEQAKLSRSGHTRGVQADDPESLNVSPFQREILENKQIMRTNRFRAKLFNSMFNKKN